MYDGRVKFCTHGEIGGWKDGSGRAVTLRISVSMFGCDVGIRPVPYMHARHAAALRSTREKKRTSNASIARATGPDGAKEGTDR